MRPVGYGRPGTKVIPDGWDESHRPVVAKALTSAHAAIRIPGGTGEHWDAELEENVETPHAPYYDDGCMVQALNNQATLSVVAEDPETVASYLITVPATVNAVENDLVTVTESGDAALDGKVLRIRQVIRGSERFERDLICTFAD